MVGKMGGMVTHDSSIESVQLAGATNAIMIRQKQGVNQGVPFIVEIQILDLLLEGDDLQCSNEPASGLKAEPTDAQISAARAGNVKKDEVKVGQKDELPSVQKQEEKDDRLGASGLMAEAGTNGLHQAESSLVPQNSASRKFTQATQSVCKEESEATRTNFEMSARVETEEGAEVLADGAPKTMIDTHQGERTVNKPQTSKVCEDSFLHSGGPPVKHLTMCPDQVHQQRQIKYSVFLDLGIQDISHRK